MLCPGYFHDVNCDQEYVSIFFSNVTIFVFSKWPILINFIKYSNYYVKLT
jgi:hypothetical protein